MIRMWRLSKGGEDNLGLACTSEGLVLGRTPLIERRDHRFVVRDRAEIEILLSGAYRKNIAADRLMSGLATAAAALNANDRCLACIAAVHLRLPDLADRTARDGMEAEDCLIKSGDWNPALHPRAGTPPNPGWFAPAVGAGGESSAMQTGQNDNPTEPSGSQAGGDESSSVQVAQNDDPTRRSDASPSVGDDWVRLPPGPQRIDELADFVEWIANAKPEDEATIRAEIKRYYYDVGDTFGGDALNRALSEVLESGVDKEWRQEVLDSIADYAKVDPAEMGQFRSALIGSILLAPGLDPASAIAESPSEAWKLGWAARGNYFNEQLGANLPATFKTIDIFENGVVTGIKSIDLNAATYQDATRLSYRLNEYINDLADYEGSDLGDIEISAEDITSRSLSLAIPKGSMTSTQRMAIEAARIRAKDLGINLIVTAF
jgi:hypothetical protein